MSSKLGAIHTAWGVLALLAQKQVDPDASVRDLLVDSELYDVVFPGVDVTVRMLLSHTSGLSGASVPVTPATEPIPSFTDVLLGRTSVARPRIQYAPGTNYLYSGAGYLVLQKLIEEQTGKTFADFMADNVLGPAQMSGSAFALSEPMMTRVAVYYRADGRRRDPYHLPGAAGGLYSTASDMALFLGLYLDGGRESRVRIIPEEYFAELLIPVVAAIDSDDRVGTIQYSLGHYTYLTPEGIRIAFHAGGNPGLRSVYVVAPDQNTGLFAVANHDNGSDVLAELLRVWGEHYGLTLHQYF